MGRPKGSKNKARTPEYLVYDEESAEIIPIDAGRNKKANLAALVAAAEKTLSQFKKSTDRLLKSVDTNTDKAIPDAQREMLKMMIGLVSIAEQEYRKDHRQGNAYALASMVSGIRELISDIQATRDSQKLIDRLIIYVLQPQFIAMTQCVIDTNYAFGKSIQNKVNPDDLQEVLRNIKNNSKSIARHMDAAFNEIKLKLKAELVD